MNKIIHITTVNDTQAQDVNNQYHCPYGDANYKPAGALLLSFSMGCSG